jgi:sugar lactone lactonase YvrE
MFLRSAAFTVAGLVLGLFSFPSLTRADFLYVTDVGNVKNVSATGSVSTQSSGYTNPAGIAVSNDGSLLFVANQSSPTGSATFVAASGGNPSTFASIATPTGVAVDTNGNIYIVSTGNSRVQKYSSSGVLISDTYITGLTSPKYVTTDSQNNIYITATNSAGTQSILEKFPYFGGTSGTIITSVTGATFQGVKLGSGVNAGFAFVADSTNNIVDKINLSTGTVIQFNTSGTALSTPTGLVFDTSGNLYVANPGSGTISEINPAGLTTNFATSGLNTPIDLAIAPAPEPSSLLLTGLGASVLYVFQRRRRNRSQSIISSPHGG